MDYDGNDKHIVFICDDNYVLPTVVAMKSLANNLDESIEYTIHVCTVGLSDENVKKIKSVSRDNISIEINTVNLNEFEDRLSLINQKTHVSSSALIKFELPNIFKGLNSILYLDGDVIVKKDLSDIFDLDLSGKYLAAVQEFWKVQQKYYDYKDDTIVPFYFNSGFMFMNLELMREDGVTNLLWKAKLSYFNDKSDSKHILMDQDAFNKVCSGKCIHLPIKYNCDSKFTNEANLKLLNEVYSANYSNYDELYNDIVVLHFIGKEEKPWKFEGVRCQNDWDLVYNETLYNDTSLNRIKISHGILYFFPKLIRSLKDRGILNTFRYIYDKRNIIRK